MRGVPSSTPPLPPNTKDVKDARIPLPTAWRRRLQCCSMTRANGGVLSRGPSQGLRKKAPGPSDLSILCFCVKDDDCGTLAESAAPPAANRESLTSVPSRELKNLSVGIVSTKFLTDLTIARSFVSTGRSFVTGCGEKDRLISLNALDLR